jgi:SAM-dependent methyltransferase
VSQACPLCGSGPGAVIGQVRGRDLRTIWIRELGIDPGAWIAPSVIDYQHCTVCDLRYFDDGLAGPEDMYQQLQKLPWYYLDDKPEFSVALGHLAPGQRVLEVGAGAGAFGRQRSGGGDYIGLEFSASAVEQAVAAGVDVRRQSLGDHLATAPEPYDAVVSFQVMEHVPAVGQFVRECIGCLRPGGRLIVSVPAHDGFMGAELNNILDMPPYHITQWSDRCLADLAPLFDLRLVSLQHDDIAPYHRVNYLRQKGLDHLGFRRTDARPVRASGAYHSVAWVMGKAAGGWGLLRRPVLPAGFGHSVTACYERRTDSTPPV